jgi:hypothetical protein
MIEKYSALVVIFREINVKCDFGEISVILIVFCCKISFPTTYNRECENFI